jgi:GNAT superfamily N-acetyltransferase
VRCSVRSYRPGDEEAAAKLLSCAFPGWPKVDTDASAVEHLRWKLDEPLPATAVVGEIDGAIAAISIRSLRPAKVGTKELLLQHGYDSCVDPDYRGTGVMSVVRASYEDLLETRGDVLIFFSSHPAFGHIRQTEGAVPLGSNVQVLTCTPPFVVSPAGSSMSWTIEEPARFDERADKFWNEASKQFDLIVARRQDFLNWRYCDPRGGSFTIRTAEEDGRLLGYAVLRVSGGIGYIVDLLALPDRLDVVQSLIANALGWFGERDVPSVQCWSTPRHPYAQLLASLGFGSKRRTLHLDWVAFTERADQELLSDRRLVLHYMPGDSDLV